MLNFSVLEWVNRTSSEIQAMKFGLREQIKLTFANGDEINILGRMAQCTHPFLRWARLFNFEPSKEMFVAGEVWLTPGLCVKLVNQGIQETLDAWPELRATDLGGIALDIATETSNLQFERVEYLTTIDVEDYHQIENDAEIKATKRKAIVDINEATSGAARYRHIVHVHQTLENRLKEGYADDFHYNMLSILINAGSLKLPQLRQSIFRGYVTDVNSEFAPNPITSGIYTGLRTPYEAYMESLSGAKSQFFTKEPVRATEYTNRQMQLIGGFFRNIHAGDCGSTSTYKWDICDKSELARFEGKNIILDDGRLHEIKATDSHLIGKIVKVRNPAGCIHPDKVGVCSTCVGGVARSIPYNVMSGVGLITELFAQITQRVISVKHDDTSEVGRLVRLPEHLQGILTFAKDARTLLADTRKGYSGLNLAIEASNLLHLNELEQFGDLDEINPNRLSDIDDILIWWNDSRLGLVRESMRISNGKTKGKLTKEFLSFLKDNPQIRTQNKIDKTQVVNINLDVVPTGMSIISMPFKHTSMLDIHRKVDLFFRSSADNDDEEKKTFKYNADEDPFLADQTSFVGAIHTFNDMIKDKFSINQAVLECSIWPFTVTNKDEGNWYPIKGTGKCEFGKMSDLVLNRTLSVHAIHQKQFMMYQSPLNILQRNPVPHAYDETYV